MPRRLAFTLAALGLFVAVASTAALWVGVNDARLGMAGPRRAVRAEALGAGASGWFAVAGCVRHDLAVGVTPSLEVYPLGARSPGPDDRAFTPLAAAGDCDEGHRPKRLFALIEDGQALGNTIGRQFGGVLGPCAGCVVAPPPVPALVSGVIGYGAGDARLAGAARVHLGSAAANLPLLAKGRRPGLLWVDGVTVAAGAQGYALIALGLWWARRRYRRRRALALTDEEEAFFAASAQE